METPTASDNVGFMWRKVRRDRNETQESCYSASTEDSKECDLDPYVDSSGLEKDLFARSLSARGLCVSENKDDCPNPGYPEWSKSTYVGVVKHYTDRRWGGPNEGYSGGMRTLYPQFQDDEDISNAEEFYEHAAWKKCVDVSDPDNYRTTGHCYAGNNENGKENTDELQFHKLNT